MPRLPLDRLRPLVATGPRALLTGIVAVGAVVAGRRARSGRPELPTLEGGEASTMALGRHTVATRVRSGVGTPIVLLPPLSPVSSTHEIAPTWAHLLATTTRPVVTFDWLGFGHSDRPAIRYVAGLYQRQLRHVLTRVAGGASDVVAWGLAGEVAAAVAVAAPERVRRLVLVAPSGMERRAEGSVVERMLVGAVGGFGTYDLWHARRTRPEAVRRYYAGEVFTTGAAVPQRLVEEGTSMARAPGAANAARRLAEGLLFMDEFALRSYAALAAPTLVVLPALTDAVAPNYDALPDLVSENDRLVVTRLDTGFLPQWETPEAFHARLDAFLGDGEVPREVVSPRPIRRSRPRRPLKA